MLIVCLNTYFGALALPGVASTTFVMNFEAAKFRQRSMFDLFCLKFAAKKDHIPQILCLQNLGETWWCGAKHREKNT